MCKSVMVKEQKKRAIEEIKIKISVTYKMESHVQMHPSVLEKN